MKRQLNSLRALSLGFAELATHSFSKEAGELRAHLRPQLVYILFARVPFLPSSRLRFSSKVVKV